MIFDVDRFKSINDTWGHAAGDAVLVGISKVCKALLRTADIFARYGGEEFVVVCPEIGLPGGVLLAERLRSAVEHMTIPEVPGLPPITISLGVADIVDADSDITNTIHRADKALYQAKEQGRNAVVAYHPS